MDFDAAVGAHVAWKIAFRTAVNKRRGIDAPMIGLDDQCPFGQWLHGEAKRRYGSLDVYRQCVETHARFHREAARVAEMINKGDFAGAEAELSSGSTFGEASTMAVTNINKFKRAV